MDIKTGMGYDIHRFIEGRKLILGGVEIPYDRGLDGHSDADVLLHAICDALLGALGQDDIGKHFPNTDGEYKDASSIDLLKTVFDMVKEQGYRISNVDTMIQAEEPNLKDYKYEMRKKISDTLELSSRDVNIKATTQEKLGSLGKGEGMAAFANVLLIKE